MGYTQQVQIQEQITLSDDLIGASDSIQTTLVAAYVPLKKIVRLTEIYPVGVLRIKFSMNSSAGLAYGKIYRNGIPIGTERSCTTASTEFSEDFSFTDLGVFDQFEVWGKASAGNLCRVFNFRIYGNPVNMAAVS